MEKPAVESSTENPAPPIRRRMSLKFSKIIVVPDGTSGKILILCGPTTTSYQGLAVVPTEYEVAPGIRFPPKTTSPPEGSILISPVAPVTPEIVLFWKRRFPIATVPAVDPASIEISVPSKVKEFDPLRPVPPGVNITELTGEEREIDVPLVPEVPESPVAPLTPEVPDDPEVPEVPGEPFWPVTTISQLVVSTFGGLDPGETNPSGATQT